MYLNFNPLKKVSTNLTGELSDTFELPFTISSSMMGIVLEVE